MVTTANLNNTAQLSLPDPDSIARRTLDNGITVLSRDNFLSPSVVLTGYLRVGGVDDPPVQAGLAGFVADMLDHGTQNRTFDEISEAVESIGASLGVSGGLHIASFGMKCLAEDLDHVLEILADVIRNPVFPEKETEKVRGQLLTGLQERDNNTRSTANLTFLELAYPQGHPYGRSTDGYVETIDAIDREDLAAFHDGYYRPTGAIVAVAGAVDPEQAISKVEEVLGDWQPAGPRPPQEVPEIRFPDGESQLTETRREFREMRDKSQTDIVLGIPGISRKDPNYYSARTANTILGTFGIGGRLGDSVRDEQGMAYYISSRLSAHLGRGPWRVFTGVNPANVARAIDTILAEIHRIQDEAVSEEELDDAKSYMTGSLPLGLETNEGVASTLLDMELFELGLDYVQRYPDLINAITVEQVQQAAQRVFPRDAYALAIAGPPMREA
ncbi:MAG: putative zinc protease [Anaerolineales bacterium]|nr:putative zinc protease [Anaerolineales bacterium]